MVLSLVATNIQLCLLLHAGVVMTALKLSAKLRTCAVFFIIPDNAVTRLASTLLMKRWFRR